MLLTYLRTYLLTCSGGGDHGPRPRDAAHLLRRDATPLAGRAQADGQNPTVARVASTGSRLSLGVCQRLRAVGPGPWVK